MAVSFVLQSDQNHVRCIPIREHKEMESNHRFRMLIRSVSRWFLLVRFVFEFACSLLEVKHPSNLIPIEVRGTQSIF
jgi:hypothetical protein